MNSKLNSIEFRDLVLNVRVPVVIKAETEISWNCFRSSLAEWCNTLQAEMHEANEFTFEIGKRKHSAEPQWEYLRQEKKINMCDFLNEKSEFLTQNWACLSYRNILQLPESLRRDIQFSDFGFTKIENHDTTFWLNTSGSNTSCHYDTYGCNIVVQVFGKKQWLLFPPNANLTPIRIPYEESSVYCSENFYSPKTVSEFAKIKDKCHRCVLEKGDILIVPKNWWHYVECLETSLSFNHWISLENDIESQLEECIVKYLMERCLATETEVTIANFLNPNQITALAEESEVLCILKELTAKVERYELQSDNDDSFNSKRKEHNRYPYFYLTEIQLEKLIENFNINMKYVEKMSEKEFLDLLQHNSLRYDGSLECKEEIKTSKINFKQLFINSICNPTSIACIRKLLVENYRKSLENI